VLRFGRYVRLTEERLARAESFFTRYGGKIVIVAQFIRASPRPTASSPGSPGCTG
jgi:membrane protein DedA with SNARE-associated domain